MLPMAYFKTGVNFDFRFHYVLLISFLFFDIKCKVTVVSSGTCIIIASSNPYSIVWASWTVQLLVSLSFLRRVQLHSHSFVIVKLVMYLQVITYFPIEPRKSTIMRYVYRNSLIKQWNSQKKTPISFECCFVFFRCCNYDFWHKL